MNHGKYQRAIPLSNPQSHREFIIQSTSGTTSGKPFLIPRSHEYIEKLFHRILKNYNLIYKDPPQKIALFGGASHLEAAKKFNIEDIEVKNFNLSSDNNFQELELYNPDMLSCFPTIMREILGESNIRLPNLKFVKLGGEKIFKSDINKIFKRFKIPVLEQLGSTEMTAVAFRMHENGNFRLAYRLEENVFDFYLKSKDGWCDLVVKDKFPDKFFKLTNPYFTGDEVFINNGEVTNVRRKDDIANNYFDLIERLLITCENIQIDIKKSIIYYTGDLATTNKIIYNNKVYTLKKVNMLTRCINSNKLPFLV